MFYLLFGLGRVVPLLGVFCFGKKRIFNVMAHFVDGSAKRRQADGAFVASLLDSCEMVLGQTWWIHRDSGDSEELYDELDHRRNWQKGKIVEVSGTHFRVKLEGEQQGAFRSLPIALRCMPAQELLQHSRESLRCIPWERITKDLMTGRTSSGLAENEQFKLSRPLEPNERIDLFMSHSWHDM